MIVRKKAIPESGTKFDVLQDIIASKAVTDICRLNLGYQCMTKKSQKRNPAPVPKHELGCKAESKGHCILEFNLFRIEIGKRAKSEGIHSSEFRWAILAAPPKGVEELINSDSHTCTTFIKEFEESESGETLYFCLRWENARGEKGPWSDISSTVIP
jgi:hypothetical protein